MFKDPWVRYGALGAIGFVLGWAVPEYFIHDKVAFTPFAGGIAFFITALLVGRYLRHMQK